MPLHKRSEGRLGVVHLVRACNGVTPFQAFLDSYRRCPGGVEHDLVLLFKGFGPRASRDEYTELLGDTRYRAVEVPDVGFDIGAYAAAAALLPHEHLCFLNSFAVPVDGEWLRKLYSHAVRRGVGMVAATGSFGSIYSFARYEAGLDSHYATVFSGSNVAPRVAASTRMVRRLQVGRLARRFGSFPAVHLRTNAFVIARNQLLAVRPAAIRRKLDAMAFESGAGGLTSRLREAGLEPLVVGRDGIGYTPDQWPESGTFWQDRQENLLVSDNQTRDYESGSAARREFLSRYAWGERARPW